MTTKTDWTAAKLVVIAKWSCSRQIITSYDAETGEFALETNEAQPPWKNWNERGDRQLVRLENVDFGFTEPGDWLYDEKAGRIRSTLHPRSPHRGCWRRKESLPARQAV